MPIAFEDILADPKFQAEPLEVRQQVAQNYFMRNIAPQYKELPAEHLDRARSEFVGMIRPERPAEPSLSGFLNTVIKTPPHEVIRTVREAIAGPAETPEQEAANELKLARTKLKMPTEPEEQVKAKWEQYQKEPIHQFGSALQRTVGTFFNTMLAGVPELISGKGPGAPESTIEGLAHVGAELAGFLTGPFAISRLALAGKLPTARAGSSAAINFMRGMVSTGAEFGLAQTIAGIAPSASHPEATPADVTRTALKNAATGSLIGMLFPTMGIIPTAPLRGLIGAGVLNEVSNLLGEGRNIGETISDIKERGISPEAVNDLFKFALDAYMTAKQPAIRDQWANLTKLSQSAKMRVEDAKSAEARGDVDRATKLMDEVKRDETARAKSAGEYQEFEEKVQEGARTAMESAEKQYASVQEEAKRVAERKEKAAKPPVKEEAPAPEEPLSTRLAKAVGRPEQVGLLDKMEVAGKPLTEEQRVAQVVNDAVTQKMRTAEIEKDPEKKAQLQTEARDAADKLLQEDGVLVDRMVEQALKPPEVKPKVEVPIEERTFPAHDVAEKVMKKKGLEATHEPIEGADRMWRILPKAPPTTVQSAVTPKPAPTDFISHAQRAAELIVSDAPKKEISTAINKHHDAVDKAEEAIKKQYGITSDSGIDKWPAELFDKINAVRADARAAFKVVDDARRAKLSAKKVAKEDVGRVVEAHPETDPTPLINETAKADLLNKIKPPSTEQIEAAGKAIVKEIEPTDPAKLKDEIDDWNDTLAKAGLTSELDNVEVNGQRFGDIKETPDRKNKIFSEKTVNEARERARSVEKGEQLMAGLDPGYLKDVTILTIDWLETRARNFGEFVKHMIDTYGPEVRPYLHKAWGGALTKMKLEEEVYKNMKTVAEQPNTPLRTKTVTFTVGGIDQEVKVGLGTAADYGMAASVKFDLPVAHLYFESKASQQWSTRTMVRLFEWIDKANNTHFMDIFHRYNANNKAMHDEMNMELKLIDEAVKKSAIGKTELSKRLATAAIAKQVIGVDSAGKPILGTKILEAMGVKTLPQLSRQEQAIDVLLSKSRERMWPRLNEARLNAGLEPIGFIEDYFTFERVVDDLGKKGHTLGDASASTVHNAVEQAYWAFVHPKATTFKYTDRKNAIQQLSLDYFGVHERYMRSALNHIHMTPIMSQVRNVLNDWTTKDAKVPEDVSLKTTAPRLYNALTEWADYIGGKQPPSELPDFAKSMLFRLRTNLAAYQLVGNLRTYAVQFAAYVQAVPHIGVNNMLSGAIRSLTHPIKAAEEAYKLSNVLGPRREQFETAITDIVDTTRRIIAEEPQFFRRVDLMALDAQARLSRIGSYLTTLFDAIAAQHVWYGAMNLAKTKGLRGEAAINFADDTVIRTQGSALPGHISAVQRRPLGRTMTLYQTFAINEWGNIIEDCLGLVGGTKAGRPLATDPLKRAVTLAVSIAAANFIYEDLLGMSSPFMTPFRRLAYGIAHDKPWYETALAVVNEAIQNVPIIGGALQYGSHPLGAVVNLLGQTAEVFGGRPGPHPSGAELAAKWLGLPGGGQAAKSFRAAYEKKKVGSYYEEGKLKYDTEWERNPEASWYDIIMGNYTKQRQTALRDILNVEEQKYPSLMEELNIPKEIERIMGDHESARAKVGRRSFTNREAAYESEE